MNIACIIPAYNEQKRIIRVLRPVLDSKLFSQVIVVDDGSTDHTGTMAHIMGASVVNLTRNRGKSIAVSHGLFCCQHADYICLLDADLDGLMIHNLIELTAPVRCGTADATISSRTSYGGLWHLDFDMFSGERVLPLKLLEDCHLETRSSFEMEVVINGALIDYGARISVVDWPNVSNPTKAKKYGVWQGVKRDWRMFNEMRRVGGMRALVKQRVMLGRQVV